jgi:beta-lactamase class A
LPGGRRIAVAFFARGGSNRPRAIAEAARTIYYGFAAAVRTSFNAAVNPSSPTWTLQSQP